MLSCESNIIVSLFVYYLWKLLDVYLLILIVSSLGPESSFYRKETSETEMKGFTVSGDNRNKYLNLQLQRYLPNSAEVLNQASKFFYIRQTEGTSWEGSMKIVTIMGPPKNFGEAPLWQAYLRNFYL